MGYPSDMEWKDGKLVKKAQEAPTEVAEPEPEAPEPTPEPKVPEASGPEA